MGCQLTHALFAVHGQEDGCHQSHQGLVGANVGRRFLPADVLLAGGKSEHKAAPAFRIQGFAHQAARHLPQILFLGGDHAAVGTAEAQGHAKGLRFEGNDIGLDRRPHHPERDCLGNRHNQQRAFPVHNFSDRRDVFDHAEKVWRLNQHAGSLFGDAVVERRQIQPPVVAKRERLCFQPLVLRVGTHHFPVLGVNGPGHEDAGSVGNAHRHGYRFRCPCRSLVHRGVGNIHAGQLADHGLKFKNGLQRSLGNLRLVGSVGGKELAPLHQGVDNDRAIVAIGAGAKKAGVAGCAIGRSLAKVLDDLGLCHLPGNNQIPFQTVLLRDSRK